LYANFFTRKKFRVDFFWVAFELICCFAGYKPCHHRHKLWISGDQWSAPFDSAASTKGCQPCRVSGIFAVCSCWVVFCPRFLQFLCCILLYGLRGCVCIFSRLLSIAEETLAQFLSKATGTAVEWVQMPGMKVTTHFDIIIYFVNPILWTLSLFG
jgi:hypothetical protein